jgi:hypothetical protein
MFMSVAMTTALVAGAPVDATKLTLSAPASVAEIDTGKLKGDLFRLSWSPDAQQLYLQTVERDRTGNLKAAHHYLLPLDGKAPKNVDAEPPWSTAYWSWKSNRSAPGLPAFSIAVEDSKRRMTTTSIPTGGSLATGGGEAAGAGATGLTTGDAMAAAMQSQMVTVWTLKLKGEVIGEFVNVAAVPGLTFGWGPHGSGLIAFSNPQGRVVVMDDQGRKQEVANSKSAVLPAFTNDGKKLAYLERSGKKASLKIVDVTRPE